MLIFWSCTNSKEILTPTVVILQVQSFEEGGVEISADFQNFLEEDDLGFRVFGEGFYEEYTLSKPTIGENTIRVKNGLYQNRKYSCTAFIKTSLGKESLSSRREFYATEGSFIPTINNITPSFGYIGDEIEINFSEKIIGVKKEDFKIKLHVQDVVILSIIDEQKVICRVPNFISKHQYYRYTWANMSMTYLGKVVPFNYEFNIKKPKITSISPKFIDWGGEIIINGDFYKDGYPSDYLSVKIDDMLMTEITKITPTEVHVLVSNNMLTNNPEISVQSNLKEIETTNTFQYYAPEIISFQRGAIGDEIEIIGKYFWPDNYVNEVYFDDYKAKIVRGESTKLIVKIPEGIYINNRALLKIKIIDELISESKEFVFK